MISTNISLKFLGEVGGKMPHSNQALWIWEAKWVPLIDDTDKLEASEHILLMLAETLHVCLSQLSCLQQSCQN